MDGFLEVEEACQYSNLSKVTLFRYARNGIIQLLRWEENGDFINILSMSGCLREYRKIQPQDLKYA